MPTGKQLAPVFTQGVDIIAIAFTEDVDINGSEFTLFGSNGTTITHSNFFYDTAAHAAIWSFSDPLPHDKYRIELSTAIEDATGNALDGEWENMSGMNEDGPTWDDFSDDPTGRTFLTGNGVAGRQFSFFFSLLPGDSNQDGLVEEDDALLANVADIDGDGDQDQDDVDLVEDILNTTARFLPAAGGGDYRDDETVGADDYQVWKGTFGSTTELRADGNGNGQVDTADFVVWGE